MLQTEESSSYKSCPRLFSSSLPLSRIVLPKAAEPRPGSFMEKETPVRGQCFVPQLTQKQAADTLPHQPHRHRPTHNFLGEDLQMILQVKKHRPLHQGNTAMCPGSCRKPAGELTARAWARIPVLSPTDIISTTSKRASRRGTQTAVHTERCCKGTPGAFLQGMLQGRGGGGTSGRQPSRAAPRGSHPGAPCAVTGEAAAGLSEELAAQAASSTSNL